MKLLKYGIRFWITITSILSFLAGWILLAHAPKPAAVFSSSNVVAPLPTLEPLEPLSAFGSDANGFQNQPSFSLQPRMQFRPTFRTGGS